jgi:uncharacterized protein
MQIITGLIRRGYPSSEVMRVLAMEEKLFRAGSNEPCSCGSGIKFKRCLGLKKKEPERRDEKQVTHRTQA